MEQLLQRTDLQWPAPLKFMTATKGENPRSIRICHNWWKKFLSSIILVSHYHNVTLVATQVLIIIYCAAHHTARKYWHKRTQIICITKLTEWDFASFQRSWKTEGFQGELCTCYGCVCAKYSPALRTCIVLCRWRKLWNSEWWMWQRLCRIDGFT